MFTQLITHLREDTDVKVSTNCNLVPGTHAVKVFIGDLEISVFGSTRSLINFRNAIAAGITIKEDVG